MNGDKSLSEQIYSAPEFVAERRRQSRNALILVVCVLVLIGFCVYLILVEKTDMQACTDRGGSYFSDETGSSACEIPEEAPPVQEYYEPEEGDNA